MTEEYPRPEKLSVIAFSGDYEKVHYALVTAAAAAAIDTPVTLFFTMDAIRALVGNDAEGNPGWHRLAVGKAGYPDARSIDQIMRSRGVVGFTELLDSCVSLHVKIMVCEMGLRAADIPAASLRGDLDIQSGGLVTFLNDARAKGAMLFI
jgi:peroxiredoxin family protein